MLRLVVIMGTVSRSKVTSENEVLLLFGVAPIFRFLRPTDDYYPLKVQKSHTVSEHRISSSCISVNKKVMSFYC